MVTGRISVFGCAANFLRGRKCIFCGSFKIIHTSRGYARCSRCGKSVVFWLLERDGRVYTKVVESVSVEELMQHIQAKTHKGSVYFTDAFRGYQSLKRYGKHHTVSHSKSLVNRRTKNHINGIEGFWSYAKHLLYH